MKILKLHISDQQARELMDRFLDGSTSLAEEKKLYSYFRRANIAPDMEQHRDMMRWYASGMAQKKALNFSAAWKGAVASAVIIAAGVGAAFLKHASTGPAYYAQYEGSYVMINGEKVTNLKEIMPYLNSTEMLAHDLFEKKPIYESYLEHRRTMMAEIEKNDIFEKSSLADEMSKIFDEN